MCVPAYVPALVNASLPCFLRLHFDAAAASSHTLEHLLSLGLKVRAASHLSQCSFSQRCMRRAAAATRLRYTFAFDARAHTLCRDLNAVLNSHSASLQLLAVAALAIAAALSLHLCRWRIVA